MLLSVQDLVVRFRTEDGTVYAVNGVSFDLDASETLGIVGESGCGKSVTSLAITGLLPRGQASIPGGHILFDGVDLVNLPDPRMRELRGREIGMVFQDPMTSLNPVLTIGRQLIEALCAEALRWKRRAPGLPFCCKPSRFRHRRHAESLSPAWRHAPARMIAMALALRLGFIADEPTTALGV
jgi:ABC-type dipeptide/oligopeptide/nickel transport system ATPase component